MEVNVCFLTDDGYSMPTVVAIQSLIQNKKGNIKYNIYVLCIDISDLNVQKFNKLNQNNVEIKIIKLDNKYDKFYMKGVSASPTALYKFSIPKILNEIDKVIYLDGDILVNSDLSELYNLDISDNYIGAVIDINLMFKRHLKKIIDEKLFYFNSGVMLMNLKKMREDNVTEKLVEYRLNGYNELMDQDAFNYVLRGKVFHLPFKYNTQTMITIVNKNINDLDNVLKLPSNIQTFDDVIKESTIIHYSLKNKPWKSTAGCKFVLWLYYYYLSPYNNDIIQRKSICATNKNIFIRFKNLKKNYRRYKFFSKFSDNKDEI